MTEQTHQATEHAQPARQQTTDYAPQASHPLIQLQGVIGNYALLHLLNRKTIQRFARQADIRQQQFVLAAQNYGLEEGDAKALYQLSGGAQADPVTGFEDASDRDPTLARAIQAVGQSGEAGFTVDVSIRNLGGLNAELGHNEADKILNTFAKIVGDAMAGVGGDVSKFRQSGTELRFIVVGKDVRQSQIEAKLMEAQANISKETQARNLDQLEHPKYKRDLSQKGTGIQYDIHPIKPYHNADEAQEKGQNGANAPEGKNFKSAAQLRREAFVQQAVKTYHLSQEAALDLYQKSGAAKVDSLTGFDSAADRITTLKNAMQYVSQSGSNAFYVEIDLRNLGGLTKAVGRGKADAVFARMASMAEASLKGLNADLSRFRHGGDEFSFILVGDGVSAEAIESVLTNAQGQIAEYVKGEKLADIEHPKHPNEPDKRGTGIIFGVSSITGAEDETADQILSAADLQVEAKKH